MKGNWRRLVGWQVFDPWWWNYLFEKADNPNFCSWFRRVWCRANGHPSGPIYYKVNGLEPDMRCQDCGDEI